MKTIKDIYYTDNRCAEQSLDIYLPEGEPKAAFLYMHGGGLEHGSKEREAESIARFLTEEGITYITINYRMYPTARYPEFIEDGASAIKWALENKELVGTEKLYVGGSSAGGYLSMMLCFDPRYLEAVGLSNENIAGYFHDAGQPTTHFNVLRERGLSTKMNIIDEASPMFYITPGNTYPRMRLIVSDNDMATRYEAVMLMYKTLLNCGVENVDYVVMNGKHCQYTHVVDENGYNKLGRMIYDFIEAGE